MHPVARIFSRIIVQKASCGRTVDLESEWGTGPEHDAGKMKGNGNLRIFYACFPTAAWKFVVKACLGRFRRTERY